MFTGYFRDKNYTLLYLHVFGDKIGNKLLEIFTGVLFYYLGMPLPFILLFFGLEFGLRGAVAPLAPVLALRVGIKKAITLSYAFLFIFFVFVGLAHVSLILGFLSFIFQSLSRGIYYPCVDTLHSVLIKDGTRAKQNTLEMAWTAFAGLIAVGIGSSVLANAFIFALLAIAAVLALAIVPLYFMDALDVGFMPRFFDVYRHLASKAWRENLLPLGAQSFAIIANVIVVPLFIFILVRTPQSFSFVIFAGLLLQIGLTLLYGALVDRHGHRKTLAGASVLQGAGNAGYLFVTQHVSVLPLLNGFNNTAWDMFTSNFDTRLQQKAEKSGNPLLFNTLIQMTLCFVEIIALTLFALIAWQWGNAVFAVIFLASIAGLYFATRYFVD